MSFIRDPNKKMVMLVAQLWDGGKGGRGGDVDDGKRVEGGGRKERDISINNVLGEQIMHMFSYPLSF